MTESLLEAGDRFQAELDDAHDKIAEMKKTVDLLMQGVTLLLKDANRSSPTVS